MSEDGVNVTSKAFSLVAQVFAASKPGDCLGSLARNLLAADAERTVAGWHGFADRKRMDTCLEATSSLERDAFDNGTTGATGLRRPFGFRMSSRVGQLAVSYDLDGVIKRVLATPVVEDVGECAGHVAFSMQVVTEAGVTVDRVQQPMSRLVDLLTQCDAGYIAALNGVGCGRCAESAATVAAEVGASPEALSRVLAAFDAAVARRVGTVAGPAATSALHSDSAVAAASMAGHETADLASTVESLPYSTASLDGSSLAVANEQGASSRRAGGVAAVASAPAETRPVAIAPGHSEEEEHGDAHGTNAASGYSEFTIEPELRRPVSLRPAATAPTASAPAPGEPPAERDWPREAGTALGRAGAGPVVSAPAAPHAPAARPAPRRLAREVSGPDLARLGMDSSLSSGGGAPAPAAPEGYIGGFVTAETLAPSHGSVDTNFAKGTELDDSGYGEFTDM